MIELLKFWYSVELGWWICKTDFQEWQLIMRLSEKPHFVSANFWKSLGGMRDRL